MSEKKDKIKHRFEKAKMALVSLEDMLCEPIDTKRAVIDSVIQRFEFSLELMVRLLQAILESKLEFQGSTKGILRSAYKTGLIDDEKVWVGMWLDRNLTVHTYNKEFADQMYERIKTDYFAALHKTLKSLEAEVPN